MGRVNSYTLYPESEEKVFEIFRRFYEIFNSSGILISGGGNLTEDIDEAVYSDTNTFLVNTNVGVYKVALEVDNSRERLGLRMGIETTPSQAQIREDLERRVLAEGFKEDDEGSTWNF